MTADKMAPDFWISDSSSRTDAGFHAANVSHDGAALQGPAAFPDAANALRERLHRMTRSASQTAAGKSVWQNPRAPPLHSFEAGGTAGLNPAGLRRASFRRLTASPMDPPSKPTPMMVIFLKKHALKIADRGWRMKDGNHESWERRRPAGRTNQFIAVTKEPARRRRSQMCGV